MLSPDSRTSRGPADDDALLLHERKRALSTREMLCLSTFWMGYGLCWCLITVVTQPAHIAKLVDKSRKGEAMAIVSIISAVVNIFVAVFYAQQNDRFHSRWGRRRPSMLVGAVLMCISLFFLQASHTLTAYTVSFVIFTFASIIASVPFNGLVADIVGSEQKGLVSAFLGTASLVGYLAGAILGTFYDFLGDTALNVIVGFIFLGSTLHTCVFTSEPPSYPLAPVSVKTLVQNIVTPFKTKDFTLVFISRLLFQLAINTIQQFLSFWITDIVEIPSGMAATTACSFALLPLLISSPISNGILAIPSVSRRLGPRRKIIVYISALIFIISFLCLTLASSFTSALLISALFGLAYGPFLSIEFAMAMDVLVSKADYGRDLSLWHNALVLPQLLATPIAGWLRDVGEAQGKGLGYNLIWTMCIVYVILGVGVTRKIQGVQ